MAKKTRKKQNIHKLSRIGPRSLGITLPAEFLDDLNWREKQKLVVRKSHGRLIISDWRPKRKG
ncbi:MAG: AbrB/MazE/SpoVT family DNA-binding domain-containing protein [bacterium]|nr:AbrB/MazE/SpoVT family DNA-binding domain-containing protein [bacterium]